MFAYDSIIRPVKVFAFVTYALFLLGFFFFPKAPEHYEYYYWAVLIPTAILTPRGLGLLQTSTMFRLVLAYAAFTLLSAAWSDPFQIGDFAFLARRILYVLAFVVITAVLYVEYPKQFEWLLKLGCFVAAVAAIAAIYIWYAHNPFPESRLPGIARMQYPIRSACAFGFFGVLAVAYALIERSRPLQIGFLVATALISMCVVFTQSRTGLLSLLAAVCVMVFPRTMHKRLVLIAILGSLLLLVAFVSPYLAEQLSRPMIYRPLIWSSAFEHALAAPVVGHGSLSSSAVSLPNKDFSHAHNPFLGAFRDGGLIGLSLLLMLCGYALYKAFKIGQTERNRRTLALMVFAMGCILPNVDRLFTRPTELWLFFWLPIIFVAIHETTDSRRRNQESQCHGQ